MHLVDKKLQELGITIGDANPPAANYLPYKVSGGQLWVSGQTCRQGGEMKYSGKLGVGDRDVAYGQAASRLCAINVLSQVKHACGGDWSRIEECVKITVFVQSSDDFFQQAIVANGASDLLVDVLGDSGKHIRAAVGVNALPSNSAVEIEAIFRIKDMV